VRLKIGGKIGPFRAGVSVGRSGVGWGAGAGPVGITGGSRTRSRSNSGSAYSSETNSTHAEGFPIHAEPEFASGLAVMLMVAGEILFIIAIFLFFTEGWHENLYGEDEFSPAFGYRMFLGISIFIFLFGVITYIRDRIYFKRHDEFRANIFEDRKYENQQRKQQKEEQQSAEKPKRSRAGLAERFGDYLYGDQRDKPSKDKPSEKPDTAPEVLNIENQALTKFVANKLNMIENKNHTPASDSNSPDQSLLGWKYDGGNSPPFHWDSTTGVEFQSVEPGQNIQIGIWDHGSILISGGAATGKSSLLQKLVAHILSSATPDEVQMILFDPSSVGFGPFQKVPHLLCPLISRTDKCVNALSWLRSEIDNRYDWLSENGLRHINDSKTIDNQKMLEMPTEVFFFIDDVPLGGQGAPTEIWQILQLVLARGEKVGVRVVFAASLGTLNVMPAGVRELFETRISLRTANKRESLLALGIGGAEFLPPAGYGIILQPASGGSKTFSFREPGLVEVRSTANLWSGTSQFLAERALRSTSTQSNGESLDSDQQLLTRAVELIVRSGLASTSMLQRKLGVGFARAGRLMDLAEQIGVVGPSIGSKPREILLTVQELESISISLD